MLLTSGQVSLALSSTIVFIFTTALFLCGYVVQQKTVNEIREAIKPQPRPVHTNLYVPPKPSPDVALEINSGDKTQVVEIVHDEQVKENSEGKSAPEAAPQATSQQQPSEDDSGGELIQGADGGFLRSRPKRQRKQKPLQDSGKSTRSREKSQKESSGEGAPNPRKSSEALEKTSPEPRERLSRAARRKLIQEEIRNLAGEEVQNDPNAYKRRRLW